MVRFVIVNAREYAAGMDLRIKKLREEIAKAMYDIGWKMANDITRGRTAITGPAWSQAGYELQDRGNLFGGVQDSLQIKKDSVGFLESVMDAATMTDEGIGYWRLFEYGGRTKRYPVAGVRVGGSQDYGFRPALGQGKIGEGIMRPTNHEDALHPGVMPVRMFQDTLLGNRKFIRERMRQAVRAGLKTKG